MTQTKIVKNAYEKLKGISTAGNCLVGFDGFVDEIIHVVDKRKSPHEYERIKTITGFSERIARAAGFSANIELVPIQSKLGGNGPIMANGLLTLNNKVTYIGALGKEKIHPVFDSFAKKCNHLISVADPGFTDALEFYDGKIMLGKMNNLTDVSWENIIAATSEKEVLSIIKTSDLIAYTNWTMLSNLNDIMVVFNDIIKTHKLKPRVFIDLADPKKRSEQALSQVLEIISKLDTETILSMNESESGIISEVLGIEEKDITARAVKIRNKLDIFAIIIHPVKGAAISTEEESIWVDGPYTAKPKLTTGAGDNFNAGFCNGWINGLSPSEAIAVGVCTSGFYVRNKKSPSKEELAGFMSNWIDNDCKEV